jgi:SAM-dependent methyltransferase
MFHESVVDPAVGLLVELARDGNALEFGIGTGRIALPLAQRGIEVHGIDLSRAMVDRLRAKPGGAAIGITIGDFAETRILGEFSLVYLVFNTTCNLTTQDAQVACFGHWAYDIYDCATQAMSSNYVDETDGYARLRSIPFRYVWPSELDLMARIAGMELAHRWEDWDHAPFTHESVRHVSLWRKNNVSRA